jgi:hypothetical protein
MLLHLLTAGFGTFETPTDVRCMAAFGGNPDIEQTSLSGDLPMGVTDRATEMWHHPSIA